MLQKEAVEEERERALASLGRRRGRKRNAGAGVNENRVDGGSWPLLSACGYRRLSRVRSCLTLVSKERESGLPLGIKSDGLERCHAGFGRRLR